jgi:tetratricopeptide (TPR) repeat protein
MTEKKIRKVVSTKLPLKSFDDQFDTQNDNPKEEALKRVLHKKFGEFPGEMSLSVNQVDVNVKWYNPDINEKAEFFHKKAIEYARQKEYQKAIASWNEAILLNDLDPDYHYYLGLAYLEVKKYQESTEPFKKVLTVCPIYPKVFLYLGTLYLKMRKFELAEKYIRESIFFYPDYAPTYLNLGIVYSILRNNPEAIKMYQRTMELAPKDARAYLGVAKIYALKGEVERANECFHKVIELDDTQQLANYAKRAIIQRQSHHTPQPGKVLDPNVNPEVYYSQGYAAFISCDYLEAEVQYQRYLAHKPNDSSVWHALGQVQLRAGKVDQAIESLKKAISLEKKGLYYKQLALAYSINNQFQECLEASEIALKMGKKESVVYGLGGQSLCQMKKYQKAVGMLEEAVNLNKNNFIARYFFAVALIELGNAERAVEQLEEIKATKVNTPIKQQASQLLANITGVG